MMWFFVAGVANVAVKFPGRNSVNILLSKDRPSNKEDRVQPVL